MEIIVDAAMTRVVDVPYVLAGQIIDADWWVRPICEGRMPNVLSSISAVGRATLLLQFTAMPSRQSLGDMLIAISSELRLLFSEQTMCIALMDVPDPVPATVVNALAQLPGLRWLEPDCGCHVGPSAS